MMEKGETFWLGIGRLTRKKIIAIEKHDFRFPPGSPAIELGAQEIDLSAVGLFK